MTDHDNINGRFVRQISFEPFGEEGQRRLSQSSVLVVGVGGLGSWASVFLVRMGIGRIRICDDDSVEISNLHRQAMYDESDAGMLKVAAAEKKLKKINSGCVIETIPERIDNGNIDKAAAGMDIIIDGSDNFAARFLINDYAVKHSVPWVFAGVKGFEGQVLGIVPGKTPCLRCFIEQPQDNAPADGLPAVMGTVVPFMSSLQVSEAVKILSGKNGIKPVVKKFDLWESTVRSLDLSGLINNNSCKCCGRGIFEYLEDVQ